MLHPYWAAFTELLVTPFQHMVLVWGIVPLYFGLLLNELTADKASFRTAIQTGFSFLWAGAQWIWPYFSPGRHWGWTTVFSLNLMVTFLVILAGAVALVSGLRGKFPQYLRFIGQTRFANYFMILIFSIQAHQLAWTWLRLEAIGLFAVPVWLLLHFGLLPFRK